MVKEAAKVLETMKIMENFCTLSYKMEKCKNARKTK